VVDIEHCTLRALEQNAAAAAPGVVEQPPYGLGIWQYLRRDCTQPADQLAPIDLGLVETPEQCIVV
jgi:hypothetical protein